MTPLEAAVAALISIVAIVIGVVMLGGLPAGLIVGGILGLIATVLLTDPKARRRAKKTETQTGGFGP